MSDVERSKKEIRDMVHIENQLTKIEEKLRPIISNKLNPFTDKQLFKMDGSLMKRFEDTIDRKKLIKIAQAEVMPLYEGHHARVDWCIFQNLAGGLYYDIRICFNGGDLDKQDGSYYCLYKERSIGVGIIENLHLIKVEHKPTTKFMFIEDQLSQYNEALKKKVDYDKVKDALNWRVRQILEATYIRD